METRIAICKNCGEKFTSIKWRKSRPWSELCGKSCIALYCKPSQKAIITDIAKMSTRTKARRKSAASLTRQYHYAFNESFFFEWTAELAWLVGLIWSDGCLYGTAVEISSKDEDLIQTVIGLIGHERPPQPKNNGRHYRVVFSSVEVSNFLRTLGLYENKSLTIEWPQGLPRELEGHFVRGYFDGDGWATIKKQRPGQQAIDLGIGFCGGSLLFEASLANWLSAKNISFHRNMKSKTVWGITVSKQESLRVLYGLFYPSVVPCLERKHKKFQQWLLTPRARPGAPKRKG